MSREVYSSFNGSLATSPVIASIDTVTASACVSEEQLSCVLLLEYTGTTDLGSTRYNKPQQQHILVKQQLLIKKLPWLLSGTSGGPGCYNASNIGVDEMLPSSGCESCCTLSRIANNS